MIQTDWLAIKSHHWRLLIMTALIGIFCVMGLSLVVIPLAGYMAIAFSLNAFAVEEKGKLEHLYLTLPLTRKSIVLGRYAFMLACVTIALLLSGVLAYLTMPVLEFGTYKFDVDPQLILLFCCLGFAFSGFENLTMYPTLFRLGYEKGKVFGLYIPIGFVGLLCGGVGVLLNHRMDLITRWLTYGLEHMARVSVLFAVAGVMLYCLSYRLSLRLYGGRNL
jgi:hypothetical protein